MANINVKSLSIENGSNQILGDPFEVVVHVNNREALAPAPWKATRCAYEAPNGGEEYGHGATVEVEVLRNGAIVESGSTHVCAPIDTSGHPDPRPSWTFDLAEPGDYDVRATVDPDVHGPTSTETRTITVSPTGEQQSARNDGGDNGGGDDSSNLPALGDADGDGVRNFRDPQPQNPAIPEEDGINSSIDKAVMLVALLAVAWLAASASNTVEAFA